MKLKINNQIVKVVWKHKQISNELKMDRNFHIDFPKNNGETLCFISAEDDKTLAVGRAECSFNDTFKKTVGRKLSFKRALESLNVPKEDRYLIWIEYFKNVTI